jgi:hypothetical protein
MDSVGAMDSVGDTVGEKEGESVGACVGAIHWFSKPLQFDKRYPPSTSTDDSDDCSLLTAIHRPLREPLSTFECSLSLNGASSLDIIKEASTQRMIPAETPLLGGESAIVETVEHRSRRRRSNHNDMMMAMKEEGLETSRTKRHGQEGMCGGRRG